ncbi:MAG: hypothetical protein ACYTEU_12685, partial [Planctomycetota bacterium]
MYHIPRGNKNLASHKFGWHRSSCRKAINAKAQSINPAGNPTICFKPAVRGQDICVGPTRAMLEQLNRMEDTDGLLKVTMRSPHEFFQRLDADIKHPITWRG